MPDWQQVVESILEPLLAMERRGGETLVGCTIDDIAAIERKFSLVLPPSVVALLTRIGRKSGDLFIGADFGFPALLGFLSIAESLLSRQDELSLAPGDFVFSMDQGSAFFFFSTDAGDDPPMFFYNDDDPRFVSLGWSFTEWLQVCVNEVVSLLAGCEGEWRAECPHCGEASLKLGATCCPLCRAEITRVHWENIWSRLAATVEERNTARAQREARAEAERRQFQLWDRIALIGVVGVCAIAAALFWYVLAN